MKKAVRKLISVTLSVLMLVGLIVPGMAFTIIAADPTSFPAPTLTTNPQLLKEFATPSASIELKCDETYTLPDIVAGSAESGAPVIATITEQAGPNDSVSIYGTNLEGASVYAYGLLQDGQGVIKKLVQTSNKDGFINAVISPDFDYTMYIVWVQGADGKVSAPVRVNAPKLTWISDTSATSGAEVRIYGKFLTTNNADGNDAASYVYLTNGTTPYKATITEATPYRLKVKLPEDLTDGKTYKVWVHNGHGGEYGFSNSLDITISSSAKIAWTGKTHTVKVTDGMATDDDITAAINEAKSGDTIYLPDGTYVIRDRIWVTKKLRIQGASKDKVKIVGVFTQNGGSNDSLVYGDLNVNGKATAAFTVTATPCEFSNLTFVDYIEGAEYCTKITAPENYNIDYAHGMFIHANTDVNTDTGVSGQLKIDNCSFVVARTYSNAQGCVFFYKGVEKEQEAFHTQFEKDYAYYSRKKSGSSPVWIESNRVEIANCYFETPKEIFTRRLHNGYIHDNTFVGTWVICGNSGPCAIMNQNTQNIDISKNTIKGMDEITDPDGYVVTGDQTFGRTIVFQKALGLSKNQYVMNNKISRVGELDYNSGEHILFEDENVTYVGTVTLSNNNKTLHLKDMPEDAWNSDNTFAGYIIVNDGTVQPAGYNHKVLDQLVIISKGKGAGQWRYVAEVAADRTITIDRNWDIQPDADSTFVVVPGFVTPVVYANTIEGPKEYYRNFNSTFGVNAYATMVGAVIDRNNFSQMQAGIAINARYNNMSYVYDKQPVKVSFGFVMFNDLLVMNNTITNTRYGIWNFPSIALTAHDTSTAEADVDLQLCSIIRGNTISGQRKLTCDSDASYNKIMDDPYIKECGGVSIVVGRDYWRNYDKQKISSRNWLNNVVVENNVLSDVENNSGKGFIDAAFSQKDTIVRGNTFNGVPKTKYSDVKVARYSTSHPCGTPATPIFFTKSTTGQDLGAGGNGEDSTTPVEPIESVLSNLDFSDGFKYWTGETSVYTINEGVLKANDTYANSWSFLKTEPFSIPNAVEGTTVELSFDVDFEDGLTSIEDTKKREDTLNSAADCKILDTFLGDPSITDYTQRITACNINSANQKRNQVFYKDEGTVTLGPITLTDPAQEFDFWIASGKSSKNTWEVTNITVTVTHPDGTVETYPSETGGTGGGTTTPPDDDDQGGSTTPDDDDQTQEEIIVPEYYGTEENGFSSVYSSWPCKLRPFEYIYNLNFEAGFVCWSGEYYQSTSNTNIYPSDSFKIAESGGNKYLTLNDNTYVDTIQTALFKVSNVSVGDELVLIYDAKGQDATSLRPFLRQEALKAADYGDDGLTTTNVSNGTYKVLVGTSTSREECSLQLGAEGWTTYVTKYDHKVQTPTTLNSSATSDIYLQVCVGKLSTASNTLDAAIDNIRIAKIVDGVYIDVATGKPVQDSATTEPEPEPDADTLTWLVNHILTGDTANQPDADYNKDGNVDINDVDFHEDGVINLLDLVSLKKRLAGKT